MNLQSLRWERKKYEGTPDGTCRSRQVMFSGTIEWAALEIESMKLERAIEFFLSGFCTD